MAATRKKIRRTSTAPSGFIYRREFISPEEEDELPAEIRRLPFKAAMYRGYAAKRRIAEFGLEYSFESREATSGPALPAFLLPLRNRVNELMPEADSEPLREGHRDGTPARGRPSAGIGTCPSSGSSLEFPWPPPAACGCGLGG